MAAPSHSPVVAVQWRLCELTLRSARDDANPYAAREVTVTFRGPAGASIRRPAFWDGGRVWRVRFAPTQPGLWHWHSECQPADDAGLHDQQGVIQASAARGPQAPWRHGFLRTSQSRRHFVHADGTPFFWLGDTHWQMPDTERLDACNHPEHGGGPCPHGSQFHHLVADRRRRGFTVYQTYPHATSAHWWAEPYSKIAVERFQTVFDVQMDHLAEQGFVIALGFGHYHNATVIPEADFRRFARYLVARYGAHPVVWITCQEMSAPPLRGDSPNNRLATWLAVAQEIALADGYQHPHSAHQWVVDVTTQPFGQEAWHTWFALQGGHRGSRLTPQARYQGYYDYQPTRPVLETEAMYEQVDCGGLNSTDDARQSAWKAMLCGCTGYTFGGAGIWALKWDASDTRWTAYNHAIESWYAGMALPGADQMSVLKAYFQALPWTALTPRFRDPAWADWREPERCVLATIGQELYLAYGYGESAVGTLKQLSPTTPYQAQWVDPRTGVGTPIGPPFLAPTGTWAVPEKPAGDWLLRLDRLRPERNVP